MENVRIAVLSAYDKVCAFLDNGAPSALHYYGDELHSYREGSACTYGFKASARHGDAQYLVEGNKLAFRYGGRDYYFNIMKVVKTEYVVEVVAHSMMFELLNEDAGEYKSPKAMSFQEYLDVFDPEHTLELGVNEVEDKTVSHEWTGSSTILARIFSLANVFGAEAEFVPVLADDYSLERLVMNVYREHDGENQGIGKDRRDMTLRYGVNVKGIRKSSDITGLYTAILPAGTDNLSIAALDKTELDVDGKVEFRSAPGDGCIRAVQAMERFPSNLKTDDRYILKRWSYDTANVNVLYGQALAELKKVCVPQVSYEVDGFFDTEMGDTVVVTDEEFVPALYLEARVTEQVRSLTDPAQNKTTFDNFHELKSQVDTSLLDKMNQLIREYKVYACTISTDNGIVFKNGEGSTTLTANVRDAGADVTNLFTIVWIKDGVELAVGKNVIVNAGDISGKAVYGFEARDANGAVRGSNEVTVSNVTDGANGKDGVNGKDGATGPQGPQGATGPQGLTGAIGPQGPTGATGPKGPAGSNGADGQMLYATCGTAAGTAAKAATLKAGTLVLKAGATVSVQFTYANTAASPTLNVNGTGAKAVYTQGVRHAYWAAGATVVFTYDGANWRVASEPVYANTATIGNPAAGNIFIDGNDIKFRKGTTHYAALSCDANGNTCLGSTENMQLSGDGVYIIDSGTGGGVHISSKGNQSSQDGFTVDVGSTYNARFTAKDLLLQAGSKLISLLNLAKLNSNFVSKTYSNVSLASGSYRYETVTTVSQSGVYLICCSSVTQSTSTKGTAKVGVRINGSASHTIGASPIRGDYPEIYGAKILSLSAGSSVQYWNYQNGGYGETISSRAIQMIMLCPT